MITRAALAGRVAELTGQLAGDGSPVLLYGHKQPEMFAGMLAALQVGRPYVPVDSSLPEARVRRIAEIARPGDVVAAEPLPLALDGLRPAPARPGLAYILFTSGTTGAPKGVQIPRRALGHFCRWLLGSQGFAPGAEVFLNQAPLHFDLSVMDVYPALLTGGAIWPVLRGDVADPRRLFARLDGAPLTTWVSTPSFARFCLAEPSFDFRMLPRLRRFLFCGETLPPAVARAVMGRFPAAAIWNTYGPTETTVAVTLVRITEAMAATGAPLPVGRPAPGMDVWIADPGDPNRALPAGTEGEIVIAGPQVGAGYLGAAPGGFCTLAGGRAAYRSGDRGRFDPSHGLLYCHGRLDRQVKLHGYRLELGEIEAVLRRQPGVDDAAVLAVARDGRTEYLAAFVIGTAEVRGLRRALARDLPAYAIPRLIRPLAQPPLTANGKLDRRALEEMVPA